MASWGGWLPFSHRACLPDAFPVGRPLHSLLEEKAESACTGNTRATPCLEVCGTHSAWRQTRTWEEAVGRTRWAAGRASESRVSRAPHLWLVTPGFVAHMSTCETKCHEKAPAPNVFLTTTAGRLPAVASPSVSGTHPLGGTQGSFGPSSKAPGHVRLSQKQTQSHQQW